MFCHKVRYHRIRECHDLQGVLKHISKINLCSSLLNDFFTHSLNSYLTLNLIAVPFIRKPRMSLRRSLVINPMATTAAPQGPQGTTVSDAVREKLIHSTSSRVATVTQLFRYPGLTASKSFSLLEKAKGKASQSISAIDAELCFNISTTSPLSEAEADKLCWLLRETYEPGLLRSDSHFKAGGQGETIVEVCALKLLPLLFSHVFPAN